MVVGSGLAGGAAAATLSELGYQVKCFCYQDSPRRAHSIAAQGGINAAKNYQNDGDSVFRLFYDTIKGGDFRSRESNVYRLAQLSTSRLRTLSAQNEQEIRDLREQLDTKDPVSVRDVRRSHREATAKLKEAYEARTAELEAVFKQSEEKSNAKIAEMEAAHRQNEEETKTRVAGLEDRIRRMKEEETARVSTAADEAKQWGKEIHELELRLRDAEFEEEKLKKQNASLQVSLEEQKDATERSREGNIVLTTRVHQGEDARTKLEQELEELRTKLQGSENENAKLRQQVTDVTTAADEEREANAKEIELLRSDVEELQQHKCAPVRKHDRFARSRSSSPSFHGTSIVTAATTRWVSGSNLMEQVLNRGVSFEDVLPDWPYGNDAFDDLVAGWEREILL